MPRIITNLWFDTEALEAAEFYCSIFPDSEITRIADHTDTGPGPVGSIPTVDFLLDGTPFTGINGGPLFPFTEAMSLLVDCADQDEVEHFWNAWSAGGETANCGWLKDRFGLSRQVCPAKLGGMLADPDPLRAERAFPGDVGDDEDRHRRRACGRRRDRPGRIMSPALDSTDVDELCRLALAARRLDCRLHLVDASDELRGLLDLAGVGDVLVGCPHATTPTEPELAGGDLR
jgi:predicted 3-demethylubiquinone-9 3-methyltransferase (glyoxalase superfamily)